MLKKGKPTLVKSEYLETAYDNVNWNTLSQILKVAGVKMWNEKLYIASTNPTHQF